MIHKKGVERRRHNFPQKAFYLVYICIVIDESFFIDIGHYPPSHTIRPTSQ